MAILMTYNTLVEKDADKVGCKWKASIIILLVCGVTSCMFASLMLHSITVSFDNRCILDAKLSFEEKKPGTVEPFKFDNISIANASAGAVTQNGVTNLRNFFPGVFDKKETAEIPETQLDFLTKKKIDDIGSRWGKPATCDYGIFIPIFEACFGIIMTTFFLICGQGGRSKIQSLLPQPWRIVLPATIYFLLMTIVAIIHIVLIVKGSKSFCESFADPLIDFSCSMSMNNFVLITDSNRMMYPGTSFILLNFTIWTTLFCWVASFITMLCRIVFVADFELVRVTVKSSNAAGKSSEYTVVTQSNDDDNSSGSQQYYSLEPFADDTDVTGKS